MILKSLYLKNYRTYRGPETIEFAHGDKNVTIIQGNNEVGKTTIMNAITWCLYGAEYYKNEGKEPIWSKSSFYDLNPGDEDKVEVTITMEDSKKREVKFIRELEFYKNDIGDGKQGDSSFEILIEDQRVSFKDTYINKHLPEKIREYFLFDGEQLEKYFKEDNKNIKDAVYKLSQLNLLENISKHISNRESEYIDSLRKLNPSLSKVLNKEKELKEKIRQDEESVKKINENLRIWDIKITEEEGKLATYGENPEKLSNDRKKLEESHKTKVNSIKNKELAYKKYLVDNLPKIMSITQLYEVKLICKDLEEKGYIPARFKKEFLEYLLETHECICGADLSEGTDAYNKMKELYEATDETTNIADTVNILLGSVNSIINNYPTNFKEIFIRYDDDLETLNEERESISKKILDIDNKLSRDAQKEVRNIQENLQKYRHLEKTNNIKLGSLEKEIELNKERLRRIEKEIQDEKGKDSERSDLESKIDFCKKVGTTSRNIYEELKEEIRLKLETLTSEEFEKMHWKEFYEGVSINNDYNVIIRKKGGDIVPNDLSKGGQLILALSFMTALNSLSGFELPIIIDTPMGRLDEPIKENIGASLPHYTKGKQVTLLVTGSEYSKQFEKGIRDYVGKQYVLRYVQEKDGITTIEKVRDE